LKPQDFEERTKHILSVASKVNFPTFVPSSSVKIATNEEEEKENEKGSSDNKDALLKLVPPREGTKTMVVCDFEKDDDRNFHIDFIHATANLKASAYGIRQVNRLQAKLIAGRIVPAIVTTTASVAGLVIFELYKLLRKDIKLENFRNSFMTLALNIYQISEPVAPNTYLFMGEKKTSWDVIKFKEGDLTINQFVQKFKEKFNYDIMTAEYDTGSKDKEGKDIKVLVYKSFGNEGMDFNLKLSEVVSKHKKGGFSPSLNCFPLIITLDSDDEDSEDVCPPFYYYFR
jgi:ubiquitin-activating enzyme E1